MDPTIRTVVSDLYHNRAKGVGGGFGMLATRVISDDRDISTSHHLKTLNEPAKFSYGMKNFAFVIDVDRATKQTANGAALYFQDGHSTMATITRDQRIVAGGGYSGCMYSVYKAAGGEFKCVHTARPSVDSDKYLDELRAYAKAEGWTLIHEVPTAGLVGTSGCVTVFCLTRVSYTLNPVLVRTVRLALDRTGMSVARDRWETPA